MDSEILNADHVIRLGLWLLNINSKAELDFSNGREEKLGNKLMLETNTGIMWDLHNNSLCISLCLNNSSEIINAMILKFPNVYLYINFEIIL